MKYCFYTKIKIEGKCVLARERGIGEDPVCSPIGSPDKHLPFKRAVLTQIGGKTVLSSHGTWGGGTFYGVIVGYQIGDVSKEEVPKKILVAHIPAEERDEVKKSLQSLFPHDVILFNNELKVGTAP